MHLALQNAETINRLVEQGELLLNGFHDEHQKDPEGVETEFARGELVGWRSTLHTLCSDSISDRRICGITVVISPLRSLAGLLEDYRFLTARMRIKNPVSNGLSRDRFWAGYLTPLPSNVNANLSVGSIPTFLIRSDSFGRHQSWERAPDPPQKTSTVSR